MSGTEGAPRSPRLATHVNVAGERQLIADLGWQPTIAQAVLRTDTGMRALPPIPMQPALVLRLLLVASNASSIVQTAPAATPSNAREPTSLKPVAAPTRRHAAAARALPRRSRLLLVDDGAAFAEQIRATMHGDVDVHRVDGADAALRALSREPVDLVFSNVALRDGNGLSLCRTIRTTANVAHVPVVLLFNAPTHGGRNEATLAGASDVLVKPVDTGVLSRTITMALPTSEHLTATSADLADASDLLRHALTRLCEPGFGVREWAACAHLSERQLRRRVIADVGLSPLAWLREQRLQHVQRLLDQGSCRDLCEAGGYAGLVNASYLRRLYRARFHPPAVQHMARAS